MKQVVLFFLLCPIFLAAQTRHRFINDTLYTSSGYKIYLGQTLKFGKVTSMDVFKFISMKSGIPATALEHNSVVVKKLSNYGNSMFGFATIDVKGSIVYRDGSKGTISIELGFDAAIGSRLPGTTGELILPEAFNISRQQAAALYLPAFENDTLYTSCGYTIFKGQVLQFGKLTGRRGKFKFVNIKNGVPPRWLEDNQLRVSKLKDFGISVLGNGYIYIIGTILYNKRTIDIEVHMAFDHAIGFSPLVQGELLVPEAFKSKVKAGPQQDAEEKEN